MSSSTRRLLSRAGATADQHRHLFVGVGQYVNLSEQGYPGSDWNDRVDKVHL